MHLWSLSLEMQFYVIWPFVVIGALNLRRRASTAICVLVLLLAALVVHRWLLWDGGTLVTSLYSRTDTRADALVVGALVAVVWLRVDGPQRYARWLGLTGAAVASDLHRAGSHDGPVPLAGRADHLRGTVIAVLLFSLLSSDSGVSWLLRRRPLVAAGVVSYGIYLWHLPVFDAVERYGGDWSGSARGAAAVSLTAVFTGLSWFLVERPFLRRKSHLEAPGIESTGPVVDERTGAEIARPSGPIVDDHAALVEIAAPYQNSHLSLAGHRKSACG